MAKIQLTRIVKPGLVMSNGGARIEERAETVAVHFTDPYGRMVSLAFDGRSSKTAEGSLRVRETYGVNSDSAVQNADGQDCGMVTDLQALRFLRDSLIALDLGEFEGEKECIECGEKFDRIERAGSSFCADCAASDYCSDCGEYAVLGDDNYCSACSDRNN